jgi:hypothetical protein
MTFQGARPGGLGLTNLTITTAIAERLSVQLLTGDAGCTHCLLSLQLGLPSISGRRRR